MHGARTRYAGLKRLHKIDHTKKPPPESALFGVLNGYGVYLRHPIRIGLPVSISATQQYITSNFLSRL
jgi:hypothetical protein